MTAAEILKLLAAKHAGDVFVPECKDGPTHYGSHRRMDAWVMNRSWANACATGYEIKVNRSDFLGDEKWGEYLPLCNRFYFVCPRGLIAVEEVPVGAGLMYVAKTGTRLFTKRKAPHRDVEIPEELWRYVLMCRTKVRDEDDGSLGLGLDYWKEWLERKREKQWIGTEVGRRLWELYEEAVTRQNHAEQLVKGYEVVRTRLKELGIDPDESMYEYEMRRKLDKALGIASPSVRRQVDVLVRCVDKLRDELGLAPAAE